MDSQMTFGNAELAKKMALEFGSSEPLQVELKFDAEIRSFLRKVEEAHRLAADSELVFG